MEQDVKGLAQPPLAQHGAPAKLAVLGIFALFAAMAALALAVLPMIAIEPPTPTVEKLAADDAVAARPEGQINFQWKDLSVSFGKRDEPVDEEALREQQQREQAVAAAREADAIARHNHESLLRWLRLASAGCALLGLALGPIAWARERHPALAGSAMAFSVVALLWQYILMGIVVGIVVLIVLAFISSIAA
jgi:hypothetical protein